MVNVLVSRPYWSRVERWDASAVFGGCQTCDGEGRIYTCRYETDWDDCTDPDHPRCDSARCGHPVDGRNDSPFVAALFGWNKRQRTEYAWCNKACFDEWYSWQQRYDEDGLVEAGLVDDLLHGFAALFAREAK